MFTPVTIVRTPAVVAGIAHTEGRTSRTVTSTYGVLSSFPSGAVKQTDNYGSRPPGYKEYVVLPALDVQIETKKKEEKKRCNGAILLLTCPQCGDTFIKTLFCGRQFCPVCGQNWSAVHQRKFSKVLPRAKKLAKMGYMVIEWPLRYRKKVAYGHDIVKTIKNGRTRGGVVDLDVCTKEGLRNVNNAVVRVLGGKRTGKGRVGGWFDNGITAWHWAGDYFGLIQGERFNVSQLDGEDYAEDFGDLLDKFQELCGRDLVMNPPSKGHRGTVYINNPACENTRTIDKLVSHFSSKYHFAVKSYSAIEYNPHLNILVPGEYLEDLEKLKADLRAELECPDLIVHYDYVDEVPQMVNKLKYILRPTYLDERWFPKLRHELFNFRNVRYWGTWKGLPVAWHTEGEEIYETIAKLESCECPNCHTKLKASNPVSSKYFDAWQAAGHVQALGAAYFKLKISDDGRPNALDMGDLLPVADYDRRAMMTRARGDTIKFFEDLKSSLGGDVNEATHRIWLAKKYGTSLDFLKSQLPDGGLDPREGEKPVSQKNIAPGVDSGRVPEGSR